jgi:nucleotide-binding universal stress UspA family protein
VTIAVIAALVAVAAALAAVAFRLRGPRIHERNRVRRILVPFTGGALDPTVLEAAIRIARAEDAKLVPAYLILVPLEYAAEAPMQKQVDVAMPLLEAIEHAALRSGVPVDARIESGRTPIQALQRLWNAESFDRIVVPAPVGRGRGFAPKDLVWMLTHAPSETLILRPDPGASSARNTDGTLRSLAGV